MCKEFHENRERLAELVFTLRSFTEEELVEAFEQSTTSGLGMLRSTPQVIHEYLDDLREFGVLGYKGGRYEVLRSRARQATPA